MFWILRSLSVSLIIFALVGGCPVPGVAVDSATLVKEANNLLRGAQSAFFNGKYDESVQLLDRSASLLEEIEQIDPGQSQLSGLKTRMEKQRRELEKRTGASSSASFSPARASDPAEMKTGGVKLPGGVTSRIKKIDAELEKAVEVFRRPGPSSTEWRRTTAEGRLATAEDILTEIEQGYGAQIPADAPQMQELRNRLAAVKREVVELGNEMAAAGSAKEVSQREKETQSAEWLDRLKPYLDFYGEKRLLVEPTGNAANLTGQTIFLIEAEFILDQYGRTEFLQGRTEELESSVTQLAAAVKNFTANYQFSLEAALAGPRQELQQWEDYLEKNLKNPGASLPVSNEVLDSLARQAADLGKLLPEGAEEVKELNSRRAKIEDRNRELRQRWVANTLMKEDLYRGADAGKLREEVGKIVRRDQGEVTLLRTAIIKENWTEERVIEWTDGTRTALRHRITRHLTAQTAARSGGETSLYTVHLSQDRKANGDWGSLSGHVIFTDPMLEENVGRTAS